jgi:hypothetical protein
VDPDYTAGRGEFWKTLADRELIDLQIAASGYNYFVASPWRLPLFTVPGLAYPNGASILLTDSIPILALLGRMLVQPGSAPPVLFGAWWAACVVLSGVTLAGLVAALGARGIAAALCAAIIGTSMPVLLMRWNHAALGGQFAITLALTLYIRAQDGMSPRRFVVLAGGVLLLALWINPYLLAMAGAILIAAIGQRMANRPTHALAWLAEATGLAAVLGMAFWLSGFHTVLGRAGGGGFGHYSMNALSPVTPQMSGLVANARASLLDATGGQYEGMAYLGLGLIVLIAVAFTPGWGRVGETLRAHLVLAIILAGCLAFALSPRVYIGQFLLLDIPYPPALDALFTTFRSSGRFHWPLTYLLAGIAIAMVAIRFPRASISVLPTCALLQWLDAAPLRARVHDLIAAPPVETIHPDTWLDLLRRHDALAIIPSPICTPVGDAQFRDMTFSTRLQLLASEVGTAMINPVTGHYWADCAREQASPIPPASGGSVLRVYLPSFARFNELKELTRHGVAPCAISGPHIICATSGLAPRAGNGHPG